MSHSDGLSHDTDGSFLVAQTSTPFHEGGQHATVFAAPDGWNVNIHFHADDDSRTYVFDVEQAERFIESLQRALPAAKRSATGSSS